VAVLILLGLAGGIGWFMMQKRKRHHELGRYSNPDEEEGEEGEEVKREEHIKLSVDDRSLNPSTQQQQKHDSSAGRSLFCCSDLWAHY
jgi:hypothetical protein